MVDIRYRGFVIRILPRVNKIGGDIMVIVEVAMRYCRTSSSICRYKLAFLSAYISVGSVFNIMGSVWYLVTLSCVRD
jgi:hypothetical protein